MSTHKADWPVALATWFGIGRLRPAPGTWGSAAAAVLAWPALNWAGPDAGRSILLVGLLAVVWVGIASAAAAARHFAVADPPEVVIDEVAGVWLALCVMPGHLLAQPLLAVTAAFLLFRVFDIAKPWPVTWCEHLPGGWGIMADDLAAGILAGCLATALLG
jgi:phosphatidylglycerophosphatase A